MIISHKHKFIFLHVPKAGGSSIRNILRDNGLLDRDPNWRLSEEEVRKYGLPLRKIRGWVRHLPASEQRKIVGEKIWNSYFKFAFVRNPWSAYVSQYNYILQDKGFREKRPKEYNFTKECKSFKKWVLSGKGKEMDIFPPPQKDFLSDENRDIIVDFVGRFENLQEDFNKVCDKIGIKRIKLPHVNKSNHRRYSYYYDKETKEIVRRIFKRDIDMFGYKFEDKRIGTKIIKYLKYIIRRIKWKYQTSINSSLLKEG